jgi:ATP-dependent HslUV protease subunit HslV
MSIIKSTTVIGVLHNGQAAIGADGQATLGTTIAKNNVNKIRKLANGKILVGFAGSTADAFALIDRFDQRLQSCNGNMKKAAVELAKDWRTDKYLRKLEAMLVTINPTEMLIISGTGDVLEPESGIASVGSGSMYAQSAGMALIKHASHLTAEEIVRESLTVAADICIYTNHNFVIERLE